MIGFGPSTGKFVQVCESSEMRFATKTKSLPPVVGALAFAVGFIGILSGMTLMHLDEEPLGTIILTSTVAFIVLLAVWTIRSAK